MVTCHRRGTRDEVEANLGEQVRIGDAAPVTVIWQIVGGGGGGGFSLRAQAAVAWTGRAGAMKALWNSLSEAELALVRETERERMSGLDEDGLVELHTRTRRARDKYVKVYRRQAAARVVEYGGRGKARPKNTRNAEKAEVFEDALARVSRRLATVARASAAELKAERLAAARRVRNTTPPAPKQKAARSLQDQRLNRAPDTPALRKRHASTMATGARRQARRDKTRARAAGGES